MRPIKCLSAILPIFLMVPAASRAQESSFEKCLDAVKLRQSGRFVKVEYLIFEGKPAYEFEVRDDKGEHELMCDAQTAKVYEIETEVDSASDPRFEAKIDLDAAIQTVLKRYPGRVEEIEYEIEENGMPTYEIDVVGDQGRETKVEVDALTGKIIEVSEEKWQIGQESDEGSRQPGNVR